MRFYFNRAYLDLINKIIIERDLLEPYRGSVILITGASGLIGGTLIDSINIYNKLHVGSDIKVVALARNRDTLINRFKYLKKEKCFEFHAIDVSRKIKRLNKIDYIIHAASSTHPLEYSQNPIQTIWTNVAGTKNILELATENQAKTVFLSSVEIYGENRGDVKEFSEDYCGYINSNQLRSGYPEGKRVAEALCQAYIKEKKTDVVIARLARTYGPSMSTDDSKALSQFIKNALRKEDIILKSDGIQKYSYVHVLDALAGILLILSRGEKGEAYNIANDETALTLYEIANVVAKYAGVKVIRGIPANEEQMGYSVVKNAILSIKKIRSIGYVPAMGIKEGIYSTLKILMQDNVFLENI